MLAPTIPEILEFALGVAATRSYELATRRAALEIVGWLARHKPKMLTRRKLVGPILTALCPLLAEPHEGGEEGDDDDELPLHKAASQTVDTLALELPAKLVYPHVRAFAAAAMGHAETRLRRAAVTALAVVCEGCAASMRKEVAALAPPLVAALADADADVRGQAAFALGQMAENLQPEAAAVHADVLPALFRVLSDPVRSVQERACYAMDVWCENLGESVVPYMGPLMAMMLALLRGAATAAAAAAASGSAGGGAGGAPGAGSPGPAVIEMALSAVSSVAIAAGRAFEPHLPELLPMLLALAGVSADEWLTMRARAMECVGLLASSEGLGRAALGPYLERFMAIALEGFALDYSELREYTHGFFAHVAAGSGPEFAPYLPVVVPLMLASLEQLDGGIFSDDEDEDEDSEDGEGGGGGARKGGRGGLLGDVSSDEEEEDGGDQQRLRVRTSVLDEKVRGGRRRRRLGGCTVELRFGCLF